MPEPTLKRALTLPLLVLYGLGTTIGAGIYALIGEIAGVAGYAAPLSFLVAFVLAAFTACSFAELSARFPRAAGAALYVQNGFDSERLALVVGLLVVAAGVVSAGALLNGFAGYLMAFVDVSRAAVILVAGLTIGAVAAWGIVQSVVVAATITVIEIGGLLLIIAVSGETLLSFPDRIDDFMPTAGGSYWFGMFVGVTLAFYAYIGFEDMVDVAEEVKGVEKNMPAGILITLGVSALLYILLMVSALMTLSPPELAATQAPLAAVFEVQTGGDPRVMGGIALVAIINGALVQVVMGSRVLYGLSSRGQLPKVLSRVNPVTRTPLVATALVTAVLLVLGLFGRLAGLAAATTVIMLTLFTLVNLALWRIKGREGAGAGPLGFPRWMSMLGAVLSAAFVVHALLGRVS